MASLRKFPRSPFWFACFTLPDGKRVQRSTKETKRKEAQQKANQWESLSKERAKARQFHAVMTSIYRAAHGSDLPNATPRAFIDGWLTRRQGELAPASYAAYAGRAKHFLAWLAETADRPLAELETRHFLAYRDALAARLSPTSANQGVKLLRVIMESARRDGFIADNPAKDCGSIRKVAGKSRRGLSIEEITAILSVASDEWRSMIFFGLYTGQRLKDLASLTWANIDLSAKEIHLVTGKTRRMVRIPICSPLLAHIESLAAGDDPKAPILPKIASRSQGSTLSRQFGDLLAAAGFAKPRTHQATKDGRQARRAVSEISFHSLRHTATSLMKNVGVSPAVVQDIIGHDSAEMSTHYTHIESGMKLAALQTMPNLVFPSPSRS